MAELKQMPKRPPTDTSKNAAVRLPNGCIQVTCSKCGSVGINHSMSQERISTPDNDRALEAHIGRVERTYDLYSAQHVALHKRLNQGAQAVAVLHRQNRDAKGASERLDEIRKQIKALDDKLMSDQKALKLQEPKDLAYTIVKSCPWCSNELNLRVQELEPSKGEVKL